MSRSKSDELANLQVLAGQLDPLTFSETLPDPTQLAIVSDPLLGENHSNLANTGEQRTEIVFIESNVGSIDVLRVGIGAGKEVYVLDATQDGLQQIAQILAGRTGIDALHLITHGSEASVNLGSLLLDKPSLATHQGELQAIRQSLGPNADILLYGCNVGAGATGQAFIHDLGLVTGADIAASNNSTGSTMLGGDWNLEVAQGQIDSPVVVDPSLTTLYMHVLDISNKTATFGTKGNFTDSGGKTATGNAAYKVNGSANYILQFDGATNGVINYNAGYVLVDPVATDDTSVTINFAAGNKFTPNQLTINNYSSFPSQTFVFKGCD
ncbi:MAG: DUF4347 domain-containing protein [Methylovulum sp.]|nr:DUF4347 domain-containing protein [Methylovulum sp.]